MIAVIWRKVSVLKYINLLEKKVENYIMNISFRDLEKEQKNKHKKYWSKEITNTRSSN